MVTVLSADGSAIMYERIGHGPPLVLVHGTGARATLWLRSLPGLARQAAVYPVERRGRGGSGDVGPYTLAREVEDILAVIDAIGAPVHLLGHSFGALVSLEVASRTDRLRTLILYEPPFFIARPDQPRGDLVARLNALVAAGDRDAAVVTFLSEGPRLPPAVIAQLRGSPGWTDWLALAHTLPRELEAVGRYTFDAAHIAAVRVPTLLLLGSESSPFFQEPIRALHAALPHSEIVILPGQQHTAMVTAPELFVDPVGRFLRAHSVTGNAR